MPNVIRLLSNMVPWILDTKYMYMGLETVHDTHTVLGNVTQPMYLLSFESHGKSHNTLKLVIHGCPLCPYAGSATTSSGKWKCLIALEGGMKAGAIQSGLGLSSAALEHQLLHISISYRALQCPLGQPLQPSIEATHAGVQ